MATETASSLFYPDVPNGSIGEQIGRKVSEKIDRSLYAAIDFKNHLGRKTLHEIITNNRLLPSEVVASHDALTRAHDLLDDGYGFIIPYNHFSKREPLDCMATLLGLGGSFTDAEYLSPIAWHQQKPDVRVLSALTGIPLFPIITSDTIAEGKNHPLPTLGEKIGATLFQANTEQPKKELRDRHGLQEYLDEGGEVLARGGIVIVAPQGGRRSELGEPKGRAVEMLVKQATKRGADKLAIWPMGISLPKISLYDDSTKGLNKGNHAEIRLASPQTIEEFQQDRISYNQHYLDSMNADQFIFKQLRDLLPTSYTKIHRPETV